MMRLVEGAREPGVVSNVNLPAFIRHAKISDDLCPSGIFGNDLRLTVENSIRLRLIKIDSRLHIGRYEDRPLMRFRHDIDLYGEQYGDSKRLQFFCKRRSFGRAPT